ncbi:hypothetical protein [Pelagovum pacificum]|uniref:DUF4402 domain-containing protein n=1 Tax=Pelagovum pacificum TaxID=2588711 RepID=A0A5C5GFI8_9RHOB|nr:hypothetical protein [Pelagovum pacificum]QQA43905.1 hypothetical protein I8N54_04815 [Pelagovum pacificum]TNY32964.1 hypothetical protein FHY64_06725 [Pelagovum pacificum]
MTKFTAFVAAATVVAGSAAYAEIEPVEMDAPFAISLGVTFSGESESALPLDTISASVATGGRTAVTNATAAIDGSLSATSANGGASSSDFNTLNSSVSFSDSGFESNVGNGKYMIP